MKKITLTSVIAMCAIAPAMATPTNTSSTFPNDELMQADYTYTNQATYPNTGVYDGDVTAQANYDWDLFSPTAGNYLPANSTTVTQCPAGSFCGGATNIHYDSVDQGRTACSTLGDNSYTQSAAGSSLETDCYKACTVANANISHATAVSGNDYYGAGTDTCVATACENGWHVTSGACVANTINITWVGATSAAISANNAGTCTYGGDIRTPQTYDSTAVPTGKHFVGWKFVKAPAAFDLSTITGTNLEETPTDGGQISNDGSNSENQSTYGLTENGTWGVTLADGSTKVRGIARCSNTDDGKTEGQTGNPGSATTGQYCWCKADGYQASGESTWQAVTSNPWVLGGSLTSSASACATSCAETCVAQTWADPSFPRALFGISND